MNTQPGEGKSKILQQFGANVKAMRQRADITQDDLGRATPRQSNIQSISIFFKQQFLYDRKYN